MNLILIIWLGALPNFAPVDCDLVRQYVAIYGKKEATAYAIAQIALGKYSWAQFADAKKCLVLPVEADAKASLH